MLVAQLANQGADLADLIRIEADGGLVEDDDVRLVDDGLSDADPLLVALGQRADQPVPTSHRRHSAAWRE